MKKLWFKRKSSVHGRGLFASQYIKKGSQIIEYVGDKVTKREGDRRADKQINRAKKNINKELTFTKFINTFISKISNKLVHIWWRQQYYAIDNQKIVCLIINS